MHIFVYLYRFTVYLVIFKVNCEFIQAKWKKIKFKLKQPLEVFTKVSQNSQENFCARVSFLIKLQAPACNFIKKETLAPACNFIKKETLAQLFSCEFFEISKSTFFTEHLWVAGSVICNKSAAET